MTLIDVYPLKHAPDPTDFLRNPDHLSLEGVTPEIAIAMEEAVVNLAQPIAETLHLDEQLSEEAKIASGALRAAAVHHSIGEPKLPVTADEIMASDAKYELIKAKLGADTMSADTVSSIFEYAAGIGVAEREGSYELSKGAVAFIALCLIHEYQHTKGPQRQEAALALDWLTHNGRRMRKIIKEAQRTVPLLADVQIPEKQANTSGLAYVASHGYESLFEETYTGVPTRHPALAKESTPQDLAPEDTKEYLWPDIPIKEVPNFDDKINDPRRDTAA